MPLTKDALSRAGDGLLEEKATIEKELVELGATPDGSVDVVFDEGFADAAQTTSERAKVLSLVEGLGDRLKDVQNALRKIPLGTYGICERCGKEIDPERLEAIPAARLCIKCKQEVGR